MTRMPLRVEIPNFLVDSNPAARTIEKERGLSPLFRLKTGRNGRSFALASVLLFLHPWRGHIAAPFRLQLLQRPRGVGRARGGQADRFAAGLLPRIPLVIAVGRLAVYADRADLRMVQNNPQVVGHDISDAGIG